MKTTKLFTICGLSALAMPPLTTHCHAQSTKPNVIFILMDDLGYGELGCYGQKMIETPNIDQLAQRGVRFTQHYSGCAVSAPSRSVLMTGLHTGHTPIRGNDEMGNRGDVWSHAAMLQNPGLEGQAPFPEGTRTLGKMMQEAGYVTGMVGKWGLGYPGSHSTPNKMGFDFFYGFNCQRQAHTYYPMFAYRNEERELLNNAPLLTPNDRLAKGDDPLNPASYEKFMRKDYINDNMFDEITNFVDQNSNRPFFMMWTTTMPHVSLQAPQRLVEYYVEKLGDEKPYLGERGYLPCRYPHATYAAMVHYIDEQVGKLVEQLKAKGLYENTVIVFTSDNGPTFNGGADSPFFNSAATFNAWQGWGKTSLNEGGIRVPMIFSWPKMIKEGRSSEHISAFWDFMPTLADISGGKANRDTDGISFKNEIIGKSQKQHEALYWEYPEISGMKAVRMGKWKALWKNIKNGNKHIALYNIESDPRESYDISASFPQIVEKMKQIMEREHVEPINEKFKM